MIKLSVVLATRNEEENIGTCLESVKDLADEIIVVDEYSTDKTVDIAKKLGAKVFLEPHHDIFHITKEKALSLAKGAWILQLDADEVVTPKLSRQIEEVLQGTYKYKKNNLFERHQKLVEERDGKIGKPSGEVVGYFIPRRNMFLGRPLIHAGAYPDGVIRLVKRGYAHFPQKSVHEQIALDGEVSWLSGDLLHYDSPTLKRYLARLNRYTDIIAKEYSDQKIPKNLLSFINYVIIKPKLTFLSLYFRHKGFLDGVPGFLWSFFSASRFALSYLKYLAKRG
jgi:glycosyltransferase involved in cell wall biosynthesis